MPPSQVLQPPCKPLFYKEKPRRPQNEKSDTEHRKSFPACTSPDNSHKVIHRKSLKSRESADSLTKRLLPSFYPPQ